VRWQLDARSSLTFIANAIDAPTSQDPLGLTSAQLASNREQAGTGALAYNTRKSVQQEQAGVDYERALGGADQLSALVYGGGRETTQFQAIPMSSESIAHSSRRRDRPGSRLLGRGCTCHRSAQHSARRCRPRGE
jgi:iron complex outermembrane receptor protein